MVPCAVRIFHYLWYILLFIAYLCKKFSKILILEIFSLKEIINFYPTFNNDFSYFYTNLNTEDNFYEFEVRSFDAILCKIAFFCILSLVSLNETRFFCGKTWGGSCVLKCSYFSQQVEKFYSDEEYLCPASTLSLHFLHFWGDINRSYGGVKGRPQVKIGWGCGSQEVLSFSWGGEFSDRVY